MFSKFFSEKTSKKHFVFLIIQIHFLIFILIGILWSMSRLNNESPSFLNLLFSSRNQQQTQIQNQERSATVTLPEKEASSSTNK